MKAETEEVPARVKQRRPGLFSCIWGFIKKTVVVLVVIIALSYLPGDWFGDDAPRLQQAHRITLETRDLTYSLLGDASVGLRDGAQALYRDYGDRLPPAVTEYLDPWLATEQSTPAPPAPDAPAADAMDAGTTQPAPGTPSQESSSQPVDTEQSPSAN